MAGVKLVNANYLADDWSDEITSKNILKRGFSSVKIEGIESVKPYLLGGSIIEVNGAIYVFETDEIPANPTDGNGIYYLTVSDSGGTGVVTLQAADVSPAPSWDDIKQGWYVISGLGRVLMSMYYTSGVYSDKKIYGRLNTNNILGGASSATAGSLAAGKRANALGGGGAIGEEAYSSGGGAVGNLSQTHRGGSIGELADSNYGGAVGSSADTDSGGSVGNGTVSTTGGSVGAGANAQSGFSGGANAQSTGSGVALGSGGVIAGPGELNILNFVKAYKFPGGTSSGTVFNFLNTLNLNVGDKISVTGSYGPLFLLYIEKTSTTQIVVVYTDDISKLSFSATSGSATTITFPLSILVCGK